MNKHATQYRNKNSQVEFLEYRVNESGFGASSSLAVKLVNGKVDESIDTSTGETNYVWDGVFHDNQFVGESKAELQEQMEHMFDDFEDEHRSPYVSEFPMSAKDWNAIKSSSLKKEISKEMPKKPRNLSPQEIAQIRSNMAKRVRG